MVPVWFRSGIHEEAVTTVELRVLGPLELEIDGSPVVVDGAKARTLLAVLTARRGHYVSTFTLQEAIWGGEPPKTAGKLIQKHVSGLRKHLGQNLRTTGDGYSLTLGADSTDVGRFENLAASPLEDDLEAALRLWRGTAYPELDDVSLGVAERSRLEDLRLEAESRLLEMRAARGASSDVIARLEELVDEHPYREPLWGLLMKTYYRVGRQAEALGVFRRLTTTLGEDLGIEPSAELADLEEKILLHDSTLTDHITPTNVPYSRDTFVGRETELSAIHDLMASQRLVTLTGPGGSGKTRLSVEAGRELLGDFPDGVWFIDLARVASPDLVSAAVASQLHIGGQSESPRDTVVTEYLAHRNTLLILDNCEHVIAAAAQLAGQLLDTAPGVSILATSREPLAIDGEILVEVAPLPLAGHDSDASRLFVDRAKATNPDMAEEQSRAIIDDIVRRLDGMPLAIELAAARVRGLGLVELRRRLDDRFELLVSAGRDGAERHQTLENTVSWSFQLLSESAQTLMRRLSVFQGGFSLAACEQICGFEPIDVSHIADLLDELVNKSLVVGPNPTSADPRYGLMETLREFAARRADSHEDRGRLRDAHAEYYLDLAAGSRGQSARLERDHDNLRKALRWANETDPEMLASLVINLADFWDQVGPRSEGHEWTRRTIEKSGAIAAEHRIDLLLKASDLFSSAESSLPLEFAKRALTESQSIGDSVREAKALRALCWGLVIEEDLERARDAGTRAISLLEEQGDVWELALAKERLSQATHSDPKWSIELLEEALRLYRETGDRSREALAIYKLAEQLAKVGETERALNLGRDAIELADDLGNQNDAAHARLEHGKVLRRAGKAELSIPVLEQALDQLSRSGDERCTVRTLAALGTSQSEVGDAANAGVALLECLQRGQLLDERHTVRAALAGVARLVDEDDPATAVVLLSYADRLVVELGIEVVEPAISRRQDRLAELMSTLPEDVYTAAVAKGSSLKHEEAVALGIALLQDLN